MAKSKSLRQEYIDIILTKNGDEDNPDERAFLQSLGLEELKNLAFAGEDDEIEDEL